MSIKTNITDILDELTRNAAYIDNHCLEKFTKLLLLSKEHHIFLAGAGRSGIFMKAFSNRLMHLGFSVSNVGEITSPHSKADDLLIIGSGSGETAGLISLAQKARKNHVLIALITMDPSSSLARLSDCVVLLPGTSPKLRDEENTLSSIQFGASSFEQMCMLTYDAVIMELKSHLNKSSEEMFALHADFE